MAFWVTYDHLGKLILANLVWAFAVALPGSVALAAFLAYPQDPAMLLVGLPALYLAAAVALPITSAGLAHLAKVLIETRDGSLADFGAGIRLYWQRAIALGTLVWLALACLGTSVWFYSWWLQDRLPWLGLLLSGLAGWCMLFVILTSLILIPTLVQRKDGVIGTLKLASLLTASNPLTIMGLGLNVVAMALVSMVLPPLFFILFGAGAMVLLSSGYEMLARKYAAAEAAEGAAPATPRQVKAPTDEIEDEYLNRGMHDFLFPWKG